MPFVLFNTLGKKKKLFRPLGKEVRMYTCGPTVYDYAHIGNWRSFIFSDMLKRYLVYLGYKVRHIMNVTDVDDKTINGTLKKGIALREYTEEYTRAFLEDMKALNIMKPLVMPKATGHIKEMTSLIQKLEKNGHIYNSQGSTYFRISTFKDYGKLSRVSLKGMKAGARVDNDEYEKEDAKDFVLWKAAKDEDEKAGAAWETPFGRGRPGWHIECSAMSMKYLGETLDIHTGGIDLVFPHHENEIAQSEGATCNQFVRYWVHCAHLIVDGEKMSKSKGNFYTLRDLAGKGHDPRALRYFLLSAHYRSQLNLTEKALQDSGNALETIDNFTGRLKNANGKSSDINKIIKKCKAAFEKAMNDDLNTPGALSCIFDFMRKINRKLDKGEISRRNAEKIRKQMLDFDKVLGIMQAKQKKLTDEERILIDRREAARKQKNYAEADNLREELRKKGVTLEDTPDGVKWKKV